MKKKPRQNILEKRKAARDAAFPFVAGLVRKYGRAVVLWCVDTIRQKEKRLERIETLRKEVADLEKKR